MNKNYHELSDEEKKALIDICKEDPAVFIETVLNIELLDCQKEIIRKTLKDLKKQDKQDFRPQVLCEPNKCEVCGGKGFIPLGPGIRGIKKCWACNGGKK